MIMTRRLWAVAMVGLAGCTRPEGGLCADSVLGPPLPGFDCTAALEGAVVCSSDSGYGCTRERCWSLFRDGCMAPLLETDAGRDAGADDDAGTDAGACGGAPTCTATEEGTARCVASRRELCEAGCWRSRGACLDAGVDLCSGSGAPRAPVDPCTSDVEGVMICPAGPSSGYGYACTATGCWSIFFDGPCAPPYSAADGGQACPGTDCMQQGQLKCVGRVRHECGTSGCWTPVGLCAPDGG